jgi:hypothetical protein
LTIVSNVASVAATVAIRHTPNLIIFNLRVRVARAQRQARDVLCSDEITR